MPLSRRTVLAGLFASPLLARADEPRFPSKPIRIIVPASVGTALDSTARFIAPYLARALDTPVLVENRIGASGVIGTELVAKAQPDGHTLLLSASTHYIPPWTMASVPYDTVRDFAPVARVSTGPLMLLVPANSAYKTLKDLVADLKSRPGELAYASAGEASTTNYAMVMFNALTNTRARHVPYPGAAQAVTDTVGGHVAMTFQSIPSAMALVKAGRLRALGVTGLRELDSLPGVPAIVDSVPGYDLTIWLGMFAPAATPKSVVAKLSAVLMRMTADASFKDYVATQSALVDALDSAEMAVQAPIELEKWRRIVELSTRV